MFQREGDKVSSGHSCSAAQLRHRGFLRWSRKEGGTGTCLHLCFWRV